MLYSGIPNPSWELRCAQIHQLLDIISRLSSTLQPIEEVGLGYSGFRVTNDGHSKLPASIQVHNGIISFEHENGSIENYLDPHRELERFLLHSGKRVLEPSLFREVEEQIWVR